MKSLDDVVAAVRAAVSHDNYGEEGIHDAVLARVLHTRCRAAIERFAPPDSAYRSGLASIDDNNHITWRAQEAGAIVQALRDDYALGGLDTIAELVHADLFDDFLEMARELLAGSVLEEHLRKLATKSQIASRTANGAAKSVETLSVDLRKAGAFSELQRKGCFGVVCAANGGGPRSIRRARQLGCRADDRRRPRLRCTTRGIRRRPERR
jgi:hypothetical protein